MSGALKLGPADAAVLETFVVPRYLSIFGEAALDLLLVAGGADLAHIGCRTGYPDRAIAERLSEGTITGIDASASAIDLARTKSALLPNVTADYRVHDGLPTPLASSGFTHGLSLHPPSLPEARRALLAEMARVVVPRGQVLVALPMRGSFQEVLDLLREYALKHDAGDVGKAVESAAAARPNVETLSEELEAVGFGDVDIDLRPVSLEFQSGRDFLEDPVMRLLLLPDLQSVMQLDDLAKPLEYVRSAIDRYWAEEKFELTVNVGCASGRRAG